MDRDSAHHIALSLLGLPVDKHAALFAIQDQLDAWRAEHPGDDPFLSGECDALFVAVSRLVMRSGDDD